MEDTQKLLLRGLESAKQLEALLQAARAADLPEDSCMELWGLRLELLRWLDGLGAQKAEKRTVGESFWFYGIVHSLSLIRRTLFGRPDSGGVTDYLTRVLQFLDRFGRGEAEGSFSCSLVLRRGRDVEQLDFSGTPEALTVSEGGFVLEAAQDGDIYGDWSFVLWDSGEISGHCQLSEQRILDLLSRGAVLEPGPGTISL